MRHQKIVYRKKPGRIANSPKSLKFYVMSLFRALDKAGQFKNINSYNFVTMVVKKFPNSKFNNYHFHQYKHQYRKLRSLRKLVVGPVDIQPEAPAE